MPTQSKVLAVFDTPATFRELHAAACAVGGIELLPLRDRRTVGTFVSVHPNLTAVVVEHTGESRAALEVLQNLQAAHPTVRRIIVADSMDVLHIIDGLHSGAIDAIVYRPADAKQLQAAVSGQPMGVAPMGSRNAATQRRDVPSPR
jgi:DNA-binding NtrC family response regulator